MARYHATQTIDIASLRDLTQARRTLVDFRKDLLQEKSEDLVQSLRLSARFAPAQRQLHSFLRDVEEREPRQETFKERQDPHHALKDPLAEAQRDVENLSPYTRDLLQELERNAPDDQQVQQKLGVLLVALDRIESNIRTLHNLISTRHQHSLERLSQDQRRASRISGLLLLIAFVAFAVAVTASWRALSPIQGLTKAATQVGQGDFEIERIHASNDEIGQLAEAFHTMTEGLRARDRALKDANQERERAYQQLLREEKARIQAERLAVVGALSARITHELRNPLSSLSLNLEMILEDPEISALDADTHDMLHSMKQEIERLESLSGGYLSLARKPIGVHQVFSLTQLTHSTLSQFRRSTELAHVELIHALEDDLWVEGDENELRGVLINLIENARIAVAHQDPPRKIRVSLTRDDAQVVWRIEDNGPGIDPAMRPQLFDPFISDRPDGTGLGLSTSRRIAEAHLGALTDGPSTLGGACFTLRLPVYLHDEAGVDAGEDPRDAQS